MLAAPSWVALLPPSQLLHQSDVHLGKQPAVLRLLCCTPGGHRGSPGGL